MWLVHNEFRVRNRVHSCPLLACYPNSSALWGACINWDRFRIAQLSSEIESYDTQVHELVVNPFNRKLAWNSCEVIHSLYLFLFFW